MKHEIKCVLVVDDNEHEAERCAAELSPRQVTGAPTARSARDAARTTMFDLALVDLWLGLGEAQPERRRSVEWGIDVISNLRAEHPKLLIVLVSGGLSTAFAALARKAGADGALSKLIPPRKAIAIIEAGLLTWDIADERVSLARNEYEYLTKVYVDNGCNAARTARDLDISRDTLYRKLRNGAPR